MHITAASAALALAAGAALLIVAFRRRAESHPAPDGPVKVPVGSAT